MSDKIKWFKNELNKKTNTELINHIKSSNKKNFIQNFEKNFAKKIGSKYSVLVSSGTNAITLALFSLNLKFGDEVIISNRTWVATAHAAHILGLKTILVDCKQKDTRMDEDEIIKSISKKTKAIIITHMNGRANNMSKIQNISKKKNIPLIEDACQALFSKYKKKYLGTLSDIGCFSLGSAKILNTYQGGILVTDKYKLYKKLKLIRNHGVINNFIDQWNQPGFNFKYTHIQACIGFNELANIDSKVNKCKKIYKFYEKSIFSMKKITVIKSDLKNDEMPLYTQAIVNNKKKFIKFMSLKNIEIRPLTPSLNFAKYLSFKKNQNFKNSNFFHNHGVYLPSGPTQKFKDLEKVISAIKEYESS